MTSKVIRVAVPRKDLDDVETARVALYSLLAEQCKDINFVIKLSNITTTFWKVANTRYQEVTEKTDNE